MNFHHGGRRQGFLAAQKASGFGMTKTSEQGEKESSYCPAALASTGCFSRYVFTNMIVE